MKKFEARAEGFRVSLKGLGFGLRLDLGGALGALGVLHGKCARKLVLGDDAFVVGHISPVYSPGTPGHVPGCPGLQ
jgi:hypothetical protein